MASLGNRIKDARKAMKLSQGALAVLLGYSDGDGQTTVSSWERDRTEPSSDMIKKLSEVLGRTPAYFFSDDSAVSQLSQFCDNDSDNNVLINLQKIVVIGRLGAATEWHEIAEGSVLQDAAGVFVAVEVAEDGRFYKKGQIVVADTRAVAAVNDAILVLRQRGDMCRYDVLVASEVTEGLPTAYCVDNMPYTPRPGEEVVSKGVVMGVFDKRAMR